MFKFERTDKIMNILEKYKYTTVDFLVNELHYSPATIRRDLTYLADLGMVEKSYGGVSIKEQARPFIVREHEYVKEKIRMCHAAAEMIKDNDYVFIDGTSTTYFMKDFLVDKKDITVITSNLKLGIYLGENGVNCYITGGRVVDTNMLAGSYAVDAINKMNFDICFFSPGAISENGQITGGETFIDVIRSVVKRSEKSVCLCDSKKIGMRRLHCIVTFDEVDCIISDEALGSAITENFPKTQFVVANEHF